MKKQKRSSKLDLTNTIPAINFISLVSTCFRNSITDMDKDTVIWELDGNITLVYRVNECEIGIVDPDDNFTEAGYYTLKGICANSNVSIAHCYYELNPNANGAHKVKRSRRVTEKAKPAKRSKDTPKPKAKTKKKRGV